MHHSHPCFYPKENSVKSCTQVMWNTWSPGLWYISYIGGGAPSKLHFLDEASGASM